MDQRRIGLLLALMVMILTGCFRQADVPLATIESQQVIASPIAADGEPSPAALVEDEGVEDNEDDNDIIIIDPNALPTQTPIDAEAVDDTTETEADVTTTTPIPSSTPIPTSTPLPLPATEAPTIPTATEIVIITPEAPGAQLDFDTATPTDTSPSTSSDDDDTTDSTSDDTSVDADTESAATLGDGCTYEIASGDTLFRIAINNGLSLEALLQANGLAENAIIQPGQTLVIPNCDADESTTQPDPVPTEADDADTTASTGTQTVHTVASGETLLAIAQRYGVTVDEIVAANQLTNPDQLSIGQELLIPEN